MKSESENKNEENLHWGDYVDSDDSDKWKYYSGEEEEVDRMGTTHNSVKKCSNKSLRIEANKSNTKKPKKIISVLDYIKKN